MFFGHFFIHDRLNSEEKQERRTGNIDKPRASTEVERERYSSERVIKLCKPERLVFELFSLNPSFMDTFLDTYPIYMEPLDLLKALIDIYNYEDKLSDTDSKDIEYESPISINQSSPNISKGTDNQSIEISTITSIDSKNNTISKINNKITSNDCIESVNFSLPTPSKIGKHNTFKTKCIPTIQIDVRRSIVNLDQPSESASSVNSMKPGLKVLKILSYWINKYPIDFRENPETKTMADNFLDEVIELENMNGRTTSHSTRASATKTLLDQSTHNLDGRSVQSLFSVECAFLDMELLEPVRQKDIDEYSPIFIAQGFTDISITVQKNINIRQLLNLGWTKKENTKLSSSIMFITENFNKTTQFIKQHILSSEKSNKRAKRIEFWIDVASELFSMDNYSVLSMIIGAIESNAIYRLKKTWDKVSRKCKSVKEKLCELVNPTSNYINLRKRYNNIENFIPFMGPFLTEIIYIEERQKKNMIDGFVNFKKMIALSKIITKVRKSMNYKFQNGYEEGSYKIILKFIRGNPWSESDMMLQSTKLESD